MKFADILQNEGLDSTKKDFKLKKTGINDKNIQEGIKFYADSKKIPFRDALTEFTSKYDDYISSMRGSELGKNGIDNAAETVLFDLVGTLEIEDLDLSAYGILEPKKELLTRNTFYDLTQYVLGENSQFFPLRNPFEKKAVRPFFFITPDHLPSIKDPALKSAAKNNCKTAFCTPNAEMVFSRKFSESLALNALLNKAKPKSKKYKSNGGDIPDHYCYLEFVIMHELLHFSSGDHFYTKGMVARIKKKYPKIAGSAHKILNYVGDYINNWQLAKSGYEQLPLGLFSEKINYDKFNTYEEMVDYVAEEFQKMADKEREKMQDKMDQNMDDHVDNKNDTPSPGGQDSEPQDPEDSGESGESGESQDQKPNGKNDQKGKSKIYKVGDTVRVKKTGKVMKVTKASKPDENGKQTIEVEPMEVNESKFMKFLLEGIVLTNDDVEMYTDSNDSDSGDSGDSEGGEPGDSNDSDSGDGESGESGDGKPEGGEPGDSNDSDSDAATDARSKAVDDAMKKNNEKIEKRDDGNNDAKTAMENRGDITDADIAKKVKEASAKLEFKETNQVINWKKILKKMIPTGSGDLEDTYSKMSRSATSSMVTLSQTGSGRISPGEIVLDATKKGLVFVVDNSGSVQSRLNEFNQEIFKLLSKNKKELDNMFIIKFSGGFEVNKINVSKGKPTYQKLKHPADLLKKNGKMEFAHDIGQPVAELFKDTYNGATTYLPEMHKIIEFLHKQNMNVIMFTDDDLVADPRVELFYKLAVKRRNSTAMFITDERSYKNMINKYGDYKWITILE